MHVHNHTHRCASLNLEGVEAISHLPLLAILDLSGCGGVSDDCVPALSRMKRLRILKLYGCRRITAKGLSVLAKALPALKSVNVNMTLANLTKRARAIID